MRDTDADWRSISEREPHFGVLATPEFLRANLTPEAVETFYRSGVSTMAFVADRLQRRSSGFAPKSAVDFGCGVGRLTFAMRNYADEVSGVDVAPAMLEIARARARTTGVEGVTFGETPPSSTHWINSCIVFQHIPPRRGLPLLASLIGALEPGGFISVQLTLYRRVRPARRAVCRRVPYGLRRRAFSGRYRGAGARGWHAHVRLRRQRGVSPPLRGRRHRCRSGANRPWRSHWRLVLRPQGRLSASARSTHGGCAKPQRPSSSRHPVSV